MSTKRSLRRQMMRTKDRGCSFSSVYCAVENEVCGIVRKHNSFWCVVNASKKQNKTKQENLINTPLWSMLTGGNLLYDSTVLEENSPWSNPFRDPARTETFPVQNQSRFHSVSPGNAPSLKISASTPWTLVNIENHYKSTSKNVSSKGTLPIKFTVKPNVLAYSPSCKMNA